jgi:hypothetical protein
VVDDIAIVHSQLKVFGFLHFPADNAINAAFCLETAKLEKGICVLDSPFLSGD